tara:strand:- start:7751 stop:7999 length:249 start_codon:yes stop_codon:yes gene_type:complete
MAYEPGRSQMSIQLSEFAHLVSSSRDMHKDQVSIDITQASLIVNDIVELQDKVISLQNKVITLLEQDVAPTTGEMDGGVFNS